PQKCEDANHARVKRAEATDRKKPHRRDRPTVRQTSRSSFVFTPGEAYAQEPLLPERVALRSAKRIVAQLAQPGMTAGKSNGPSEFRGSANTKLLSTIASTLQVTDLIALMMVFVTALSAYSTWKTAQITNQILLTSQRPYIGTESIDLIDAASPRVVAELRN